MMRHENDIFFMYNVIGFKQILALQIDIYSNIQLKMSFQFTKIVIKKPLQTILLFSYILFSRTS